MMLAMTVPEKPSPSTIKPLRALTFSPAPVPPRGGGGGYLLKSDNDHDCFEKEEDFIKERETRRSKREN